MGKTTMLVTGANGYIGTHVVRALRDVGSVEVVASDLDGSCLPDGVRFVRSDVLARADDAELYRDLGSPEAIVHLAWKDGFRHGSDAHLEMLPRHYAFLRNMHKSGCKNITVMGSMHEVGYYEGEIDDETPPPCNPTSLYGIAKNALREAMEAYAAGCDLSLKWLRGYYITGDEERASSIFGKILQFAREGKSTFPFTDGKSRYDFIDVDELARQIAHAAIQVEATGIINVCSGRPVALKDAVEKFIEARSLDIHPEYGAFPSRAYDSPCVYGRTAKIKRILRNAGFGRDAS